MSAELIIATVVLITVGALILFIPLVIYKTVIAKYRRVKKIMKEITNDDTKLTKTKVNKRRSEFLI